MKAGWFILGAASGLALGALLIRASDCCLRVQAGFVEEVTDTLGPVAGALAKPLAPFAPGLLEFLGVPP